MACKQRTALAAIAGGLLGTLSLTASAQIAPPMVTYGPSNAVPALGSGALIALALLLAIVGVRLLHKQARKTASVAVLVLAGASAILGGFLGVNAAKAFALNGASLPVVVQLSAPGGGQVTLEPVADPTTWQLLNTTSVAQKILSIDEGDCSAEPLVNAGAPSLPPGARDRGDCLVGMTLQPAEYCSLVLYCVPF